MARSRRRGRSAPGQGRKNEPTPAEEKDGAATAEEKGNSPKLSAPTADLVEQIARAAQEGNIKQVEELLVFSASYSGPIPHAASLKAYEDVVPGSAERIMRWAENQTRHRHALEGNRASAEIEQITRGQHYALIIGLSVILGAVACAWLGHPWVSGVLSFAGFGAIGAPAVISLFRKK